MCKEPQAKPGPLNSPRRRIGSVGEKETELKRRKMTAAKRLFVLGLALIAAAAAVSAQDEESALPLEPAPSSGALRAEFHSHAILPLYDDSCHYIGASLNLLFGFSAICKTC